MTVVVNGTRRAWRIGAVTAEAGAITRTLILLVGDADVMWVYMVESGLDPTFVRFVNARTG